MKCRRVEILAAAVVLFLCACPAFGLIEFKDGLTHDIDYQIEDDVWVDYESPGLETTLNILDGASIPPYDYELSSFEDSIINILGGSIYWLWAYNSSQVTVSGGSIGRGLYAYDSSQVTVSGGSMKYWLDAYDSSQVTVSGGSMRRLYAYDSGQVTISGGSMKWLYATDSSQVAVSGGSIEYNLYAYRSGQVTVSGGSMKEGLVAAGSSQVAVSGGLFGEELRVSHNAVLTLHGWDFAVDGAPVGYTELYSIFGGSWEDEPWRRLTGTLLSGDPLNNGFYIGNSAKIVLVPEPATLLLLGLGAVILRRKKR